MCVDVDGCEWALNLHERNVRACGDVRLASLMIIDGRKSCAAFLRRTREVFGCVLARMCVLVCVFKIS